ncbi:GerMN domain-containing protein [Salibacterium aidingense]|uniref:GerMN domain-containing protein n=1 Tax=Salibacterium aidingense TaxID=384933 RepID=UPI000416B52B|nr:GerMN domain-containing protein [Salibacterium aidingense]
MKRLLYLFITAILSLGILAACGQGEEQNQENTGDEAGDTEPAEDDVQEDTEEGTEDAAEETEESADETEVEQEDTVETDSSEETVTETVTLYFSDNELLETYKEEQEVEADSEEEIPAAALQAWIDGPEHEELTSHFQEDVEVQSVEESDGVAEVSFSESFLDTNAGSSAEMAITEQIALMMEQFGYEETKILIEGEEESSLFGHMDATEPITAENPDDYESIE